MSEKRLAICRECPFNSINAKKNGYESMRSDEHCIQCGCPLKKKSKSPKSKCPLVPPKWDAEILEENYTKGLQEIIDEE